MAGNYIKSMKRGEPIELVKWRDNAYQLITGIYRGCTASDWQIEIGGAVAAYDREEWQICLP